MLSSSPLLMFVSFAEILQGIGIFFLLLLGFVFFINRSDTTTTTSSSTSLELIDRIQDANEELLVLKKKYKWSYFKDNKLAGYSRYSQNEDEDDSELNLLFQTLGDEHYRGIERQMLIFSGKHKTLRSNDYRQVPHFIIEIFFKALAKNENIHPLLTTFFPKSKEAFVKNINELMPSCILKDLPGKKSKTKVEPIDLFYEMIDYIAFSLAFTNANLKEILPHFNHIHDVLTEPMKYYRQKLDSIKESE